MRKTPTKDALDPYRHVRIVQHKLKYPESSTVLGEWESKLLSIYKVRNSFKKKYPDTWSVEFAEAYPLYFNLLSVYEDQGSGGDRDLVEAALLTSVDCDAIADGLHITKFSSLFLSMYRQLFYDVSRILGNGVSEFQYIVKPLLKADSDNIAVGAVWKILALIGGIPTLARKGFGTEALKAEDMAYLLHKIAEIQAAYEEIVKRLLTLNSDIFWMLMQHISTEDMSEQLEERQEIDNLYKQVTD